MWTNSLFPSPTEGEVRWGDGGLFVFTTELSRVKTNAITTDYGTGTTYTEFSWYSIHKGGYVNSTVLRKEDYKYVPK